MPDITKLVPVLIAVIALGCGRQYSISVNDQVLHDPRPGATAGARFPDPGLQSCVNVALRETEDSLEEIDILSCSNLEIESLQGIDALSALEFLDVTGNELEHLDPLRRLRNLTSVNAPDNQLTDISALQEIPTLTSAVLQGNPRIPCNQLDVLEQRLGADLVRPADCGQ